MIVFYRIANLELSEFDDGKHIKLWRITNLKYIGLLF